MDSPAASADIFTIDFVPDEHWEEGSAALAERSLSNSGSRYASNSHQTPAVPGNTANHHAPAGSRSPQTLRSANSRSTSTASTSSRVSRNRVRTLDQFIGDRSNRMVSWLWDTMSRGCFQQWPLTLFGASGVGKSKLAMRLALSSLEQLPLTIADNQRRILTVEAVDFFRSFRRSLEINSVSDWRTRFQLAPVLLMDDLHQLLDYQDAQHELCEILDRRLEQDRPSILISNLSPLSMGLIPALASRLSAGFCCGLNAPGRTAMLTIVQRLFLIQNVPVELDEAALLLDAGTSDIGLIQQIVWRWKLEKGNVPFRLDDASESLKQMIGASGTKGLAPEKVLRATAKQFDCSVKDLKGSSRKSALIRARGVFIWICRNRLNLSFKKIGTLLGNRDHTTVMNGLEKAKTLLENDASVALAALRIQERLGILENVGLPDN